MSSWTWTNDHGRNFDTFIFVGSHESLGMSEQDRLMELEVVTMMVCQDEPWENLATTVFGMHASADLMINEPMADGNSDALAWEFAADGWIGEDDE